MEHCYKCNVVICYNPLQCDICGVNICLQCCDGDVVVCDTCKAIQEGAMINFVQVQCTDKTDGIQCTAIAVINQDCSSTKTKKVGQKLNKKIIKCKTPVQFCISHIKRCNICANYICDTCYTNCNACWKDSFECDFCTNHYGSVRNCGICQKSVCQSCMPGNMDFIGKNEIPMCYSHRKSCSRCKLSLYKATSMQCQFIDLNMRCKKYACINGWFDSSLDENGKIINWGTSALTTVGKKIYVCHKHISRCMMCNMSFPMTNSRMVKFRNGTLILVCTNCYKPLQSTLDAVLICSKRQRLLLPKDVFEFIVGYVITDFSNEKSTDGSYH